MVRHSTLKRILQIIPAPVGLYKDGEPVICLALVEEWESVGEESQFNPPPAKYERTDRYVTAICDVGDYFDIADDIKLSAERAHLQGYTWNPALPPELKG